MNINDLEKWFQNNPRQSTLVYYSYERKSGKPLASACERNIEMSSLANAVMRYMREGRAVVFQKFTPDVCEYVIKKI
jgi:hypothetical protein